MTMGGCLKEICLLKVWNLLSVAVYSTETLGYFIILSSNNYILIHIKIKPNPSKWNN